MDLTGVSTILWRERHLLDLLRFKLEEQQLLLAAGRSEWLTFAGGEIESLIEELCHTELVRAIEVDAVAEFLGLPPGPSLAELAGAAPEPFGEILTEHRIALREAAAQVRELAEVNRELLQRGEAAIRSLVETIGDAGTSAPEGYGAAAPRPSALLLDQVV